MAVARGLSQSRHARSDSKERLLDAALRLFAARGFEATSVRDITAGARCNVASVNYHFGGKEKLYGEVFRRGLAALRERRIASIRRAQTVAGGRLSLEALIETFACAFLEPVEGKNGARPFMELIAREWMDPHLPRGVFRRELVGPVREALGEAIRKACPGLPTASARLCTQSIVAQLVLVIHHHRLFGTFGEWGRSRLDLEQVVAHVVRFSAAGTRAHAGSASPERRVPGARRPSR